MKLKTIAWFLGTSLVAAFGNANATDQSLAAVSVQGSFAPISECAPPTDLPACAALHAQIRANFSTREIGMLFGAATSYPEFKTSYARVGARYQTFLRDYEATNQAVAVVSR